MSAPKVATKTTKIADPQQSNFKLHSCKCAALESMLPLERLLSTVRLYECNLYLHSMLSHSDCQTRGVQHMQQLVIQGMQNHMYRRCRNYGSELAEDIFPNLPHIGANISDIVVFNFGLWHNDLASFSGNASAVAQSLISHRASLPFLIWRESSPQHFDTPQGEYGCQTCQSPHFPYICRVRQSLDLNLKE